MAKMGIPAIASSAPNPGLCGPYNGPYQKREKRKIAEAELIIAVDRSYPTVIIYSILLVKLDLC